MRGGILTRAPYQGLQQIFQYNRPFYLSTAAAAIAAIVLYIRASEFAYFASASRRKHGFLDLFLAPCLALYLRSLRLLPSPLVAWMPIAATRALDQPARGHR